MVDGSQVPQLNKDQLLHWSGQGKLVDNTDVVRGQCVVYRYKLQSIKNVIVLVSCYCNGLRKAKSFDYV